MRVLVGIQARSDSKRLPGKYAVDVGGKPLLKRIYDTCCAVEPKNNELDIAVLIPEDDKNIELFCHDRLMKCFEGDKEDLYKRYLSASEHFKSDAIVRVTGDEALIPKEMIEACIAGLETADLVTNTVVRSYIEGWDCQAAKIPAFKWLSENQKEDREHPFYRFDQNEEVRIEFVKAGFTVRHILDRNNAIFMKTSIDTQEDLENVRKLLAKQK